MTLFLDGEQLLDDLEHLAQFGAEPGPGLHRVAFSQADQAARRWVATQMQKVGMSVTTDVAGNTIGSYPGTAPKLSPIALGSHTDTVPNGGRFDGSLGVLAAIACVRALHAANMQLRHPLEVINFAAEEATMSTATLGSLAMTGLLPPDVTAHIAWDGTPVSEHLQGAGLDPTAITQARRLQGSLAAYLELHIEQGGVLSASGKSIGVVEGIVGIRRYDGAFEGFANHAGTTPMSQRCDALVMAAPYITTVREIALAFGIVGTVGKLTVAPGSPNVIPGRVDLQVEIRGLDEAVLDEAEVALIDRAEALDGTLTRRAKKPAVTSDPSLVEAMADACDSLGVAYRRMPSGAGHDAMCMAAIAPQAMLFVPSIGGLSHAPDEFTEAEDCVTGARVLLAALLNIDKNL